MSDMKEAEEKSAPPTDADHPDEWVRIAQELGALALESHIPMGASSHVFMASYMIGRAHASPDAFSQIDYLTYVLAEISRAIRCINKTAKPKETANA